MSRCEQHLQDLGLCLPAVRVPRGNFESFTISGNRLYLSGKGAPLREPSAGPVPKVGREVTAEEASRHASLDQLCLSPQCGFSSTVDGNALSYDEQVAKLELVVSVAEEVWAR